MRLFAKRIAAMMMVLVMLASASGCAAAPFPKLPSPEPYTAEQDTVLNETVSEEIEIEVLPPPQETAGPQPEPEEYSVPELEAAENGDPALPEETDGAADAPELSEQEEEPQPSFDPEPAAPAQIIQTPEQEPSSQVIWEPPAVQPVIETLAPQPLIEAPAPQITMPAPEASAVIPEPAQPAELEKPVITLSGETMPSEIAEGSPFVLRGIIKVSAGNLIKIHAALIDAAGKTVQQCIYAPGTDAFDLEGTVNVSLVFGSLAPGDYTYLLNAEASNEGLRSERELINHGFKVAADPARDAERNKTYTAKFTNDTSNAGRIWNRFINEFGNPYAAAAILGNIAAESSFLPYLVEGDTSTGYSFSKEHTMQADSGALSRDAFAEAPGEEYGGGYGICQWTGDRKAALYDFAKASGRSVGNLDMQCDFILHEMINYYPDLYDYLKTADSCYSAVFKFCNVYEQAALYGARNTYALQYLEKYAS